MLLLAPPTDKLHATVDSEEALFPAIWDQSIDSPVRDGTFNCTAALKVDNTSSATLHDTPYGDIGCGLDVLASQYYTAKCKPTLNVAMATRRKTREKSQLQARQKRARRSCQEVSNV